jgi:hypothetical protein
MRASATNEQATAASQEERRRQNREYMRRWRADAHHRRRELSRQQRWRLERKLRMARRRTEKVCGYCHNRKAVTEMVRLMPAAIGFAKVKIGYCGEC